MESAGAGSNTCDSNDVLELRAPDSDTYISEIDDLDRHHKSKLKSVIVNPVDLFPNPPVRIKSPKHRQFRRIQHVNKRKNKPKQRAKFNQAVNATTSSVERNRATLPHTQSAPSHSNAALVYPNLTVRFRNNNAPVLNKSFETRGTQTERTGDCRCGRALKERNKKKRSEQKRNKKIVRTLVCSKPTHCE